MARLNDPVLSGRFQLPPRPRWSVADYVCHDHAEYVDGCFRCDLSRDES